MESGDIDIIFQYMDLDIDSQAANYARLAKDSNNRYHNLYDYVDSESPLPCTLEVYYLDDDFPIPRKIKGDLVFDLTDITELDTQIFLNKVKNVSGKITFITGDATEVRLTYDSLQEARLVASYLSGIELNIRPYTIEELLKNEGLWRDVPKETEAIYQARTRREARGQPAPCNPPQPE